MIEHPIEGDYRNWVLNAFRQSVLFNTLDQGSLEKIMRFSRLLEYEAGEALLSTGDAADGFFVVLMGEAVAQRKHEASGAMIEIERLGQSDSVGEMGLLLNEPRNADVICTKQTYAVSFDRAGFDYLVERLPLFSRKLSEQLALRLSRATATPDFPVVRDEQLAAVDGQLVARFTPTAINEMRFFPVRVEGAEAVIGFVDPPNSQVISSVKSQLGDLGLRPMRMLMSQYASLVDRFNLAPKPQALSGVLPAANLLTAVSGAHALESGAFATTADPTGKRRATVASGSHKAIVARPENLAQIMPILQAMLNNGASDLHLSAGQPPRWRIDGEIFPIPDVTALGDDEVLSIVGGLCPDTAWADFEKYYDCDFAFAAEGLARYRCNLFRDEAGVSAVMRLVPMHIPSMEQLGLPKAARRFTEINQGLVLVCGPTGSGKSTTLAAMIDWINENRRMHVITIEDPIEFQHQSKTAIVTQREVGKNAYGFKRAMRASLREDPDIILVGELRDAETMSLALEMAMTGHLVFSTMHTSTAISTVDRIVEMFPHEQHNQVRSTLAEVLRGVVNQQLLKRNGGGRIAAFECLVGTPAVANTVRLGKNHQLATIMTTNKKEGHRMINQDLQELVHSQAISPQAALARTPDVKDLRQRLGLPLE
ncbi:MAG: twitching motility protein PilT [Bradymonadia bacterium]|jgi:twitching motility protein PilT